jgi:hypothetical protein
VTRQLRLSILASAMPVSALGLLLCLALQGQGAGLALPPVTVPNVPVKKTQGLSPIGAYAVIAERPLFSTSRRPALPPSPVLAQTKVAASISPPIPPPTTLLAVLIGPNYRAAILRFASGQSRTIAEGEVIDGWTLRRVTEDAVVLHGVSSDAVVTFPTPQTPSARAAAPIMGAMAASTPLRRRR